MSNLVIEPNKLNGGVNIPPSKRMLEKAIVCACFSKGVSEIKGIEMSDTARALIDAFRSIGARITEEKERLVIDGTDTYNFSSPMRIECATNMVGEVLAMSAPSAKVPVELQGRTRLFGIMLEDCCRVLKRSEIECESSETVIKIQNGEIGGVVEITEKANSRIISSLLFAAPLYKTGIRIRATYPVDSKAIVDETIKIMGIFGVEVKNNNYHTFTVGGDQSYKSAKYEVEGDYLYAAPFLTAGALGNFVVCKNLPSGSVQQNKEILNIIRSFGGEIIREGSSVAALPANLKGCIIDASKSSALVPYAALLATFAKGETIIKNLGELRHKKIDMVTDISSQLNSLGAMVMERNDELLIEGVESLKGGIASADNDETLAMMLIMASTCSEAEITVRNADECLYGTSYREDFEALGGKFLRSAEIEVENENS